MNLYEQITVARRYSELLFHEQNGTKLKGRQIMFLKRMEEAAQVTEPDAAEKAKAVMALLSQ